MGNIKSLNTEKDDIFLLKYNKTGDLQWNRTWGGPNYDKAYDLVIDSSDNIYIVGGTGTGTRELFVSCTKYVQLIHSDIIIIKYNNLGIEEWSTTWGENFDEVGRSIALDSEGNIYIVGDSYKNDLNDYDLIYVKFNSLGNYQWNKIWSSYHLNCLSGRGVAIDSSDNIYILGQAGATQSMEHMFLLKYNNSGIEEWNRTYPVWEYHYVSKIIVDSSDKIYILGDADGHGYPRTMFLLTLNCSGKWEWSFGYMDYGYSALYFPEAEGIAVDSVDNVYVIGSRLSGWGGLIKFNSSGNLIFNTTTIEGKLIDIDSEDNLFITGASGSDVFLKKYKIDANDDDLSDKQGDIIILIIILSLISVISVGIILMIRKKVKERKVEDLESELSKQTSI